jgi:glutathione peroxidase-family protein
MKNPSYMLSDCAKSCDVVGKSGYDRELEGITSFFDLAAYDIYGEPIEFDKFKGQVTVLVNVASECGYTDSHYRSLVKLWSSVKHTNQINILAFPCDQFGHQEPGSGKEILNFAVKEYGVEFTMMEKIDVNGNSASVVYVRIS